MNLRVNLLEKAECRYQSGVDFKKLATWGLLSVTLLTILLVLVASGVKIKRVSEVSGLEKEWSQMAKKVGALRKLDAAGTANDKTHRTLKHSLQGEHEPRHKLLEIIQKNMHEQLCLHHLFLGSEKGYDGLSYTVVRLVGESIGKGGAMQPVRWKRDLSASKELCSVAGEVLLDQFKPEGDLRWSFTLKARALVEEK